MVLLKKESVDEEVSLLSADVTIDIGKLDVSKAGFKLINYRDEEKAKALRKKCQVTGGDVVFSVGFRCLPNADDEQVINLGKILSEEILKILNQEDKIGKLVNPVESFVVQEDNNKVLRYSTSLKAPATVAVTGIVESMKPKDFNLSVDLGSGRAQVHLEGSILSSFKEVLNDVLPKDDFPAEIKLLLDLFSNTKIQLNLKDLHNFFSNPILRKEIGMNPIINVVENSFTGNDPTEFTRMMVLAMAPGDKQLTFLPIYYQCVALLDTILDAYVIAGTNVFEFSFQAPNLSSCFPSEKEVKEHFTWLEDVKPQIEECVKNKICTFTVTGMRYPPQMSAHCDTCRINKSGGVCLSCLAICHKGHAIGAVKEVDGFFCDCALSGRCLCCNK